MTTREILQEYFRTLRERKGWESFLAEQMRFNSFVNPVRHIAGKSAYLESTGRFFSMIVHVEVREIIVEGEKACALTRYELQPPKGNRFLSDVAEVFTVRDDRIMSLDIYFDTSPFSK